MIITFSACRYAKLTMQYAKSYAKMTIHMTIFYAKLTMQDAESYAKLTISLVVKLILKGAKIERICEHPYNESHDNEK